MSRGTHTRTSSPLDGRAAGPIRWTAKDKETVLRMIAAGGMTAAQAMERYGISEEELESWARRDAAFGREGLEQYKTQRRP